MSLAIASARMEGDSSSLGMISFPLHVLLGSPWQRAHLRKHCYPWSFHCSCIILFRNYYSPGSGTLYFDRRSLGVKPMEVVFDSGSTYTYFASQPYQATVSALKAGLSKSLKQVSDPSLSLCWKGQKAFKSMSDVKEFKSLFLSFAKNAVLEIPPENYLIVTVII